MLLQVDPSLLEKNQQIDAHQKVMGSCYWNEGRFCAKEGKSISVVERREREGMQVHSRIIEERVY